MNTIKIRPQIEIAATPEMFTHAFVESADFVIEGVTVVINGVRVECDTTDEAAKLIKTVWLSRLKPAVAKPTSKVLLGEMPTTNVRAPQEEN